MVILIFIILAALMVLGLSFAALAPLYRRLGDAVAPPKASRTR